ncbi:MAG: NAD(P)/FAD-dependent oxidoreductase [Candidatus Thermoplasmatota archaeon]|nr:NAD(P)/FAD-dependent oxidoreductase [Candidatus Thermoplasmatota archaeon]
MTEVAIVGGGPAGLRVAERTASAGYETTVLEKKRVIGKPIQCAGLVSPRVVSLTGTDSIIERPKEAVINSPSGEQLVLEPDEEKAVILDRTSFDKELAEKAIRSGAKIELGSTVRKVTNDGELHVEREGEKTTLNPKIVVGADGPTSVVRQSEGLSSPQVVLPAVQALVATKEKKVQIHLDNDLARGFFLWEVPYRAGKVIGLASEDGRTYQNLLNFLKSKGLEDKIIGFLSGTIPLGDLNRSVEDGVLLVGDSACQVKPMSGGGLYLGLKAADIGSEVMIEALEEDDISKRRLEDYHRRWKSEIGKHISKGMRARKIFKNLSNDDLDSLIKTLKEEKPKRVIEEKGDIDHPSRLVKPLLKTSPELLKFTGPLIKSLLKPGE